MSSTQTFTGQRVDPALLLADDNIRFGLTKASIDAMADAILAAGEVHTPLEVTALSEPGPNGEKFRVTDGGRRQAAALKLNQEKGAGILVPILVVDHVNDVTRMKRQISKNVDAQTMTPMDMAHAAKKLLDAGLTRGEVRSLFKRPGGRKGDKVQDLSNSMLNIYLSFLELPKKVQNHIHSGVLTVAGAYKLTTKPKETWDAIIAEAEKERDAEIAAEEKLEDNYLNSIKKDEERKAKAEEAAKAAEAAKAKVEEAEKLVEARTQAEVAKYAELKKIKDAEEKKKAEEAFKAVQAETKAAVDLSIAAQKEQSKAQAAYEKLQKATEERAKKLADARKNADRNAKKAIGPAAVEKAAAKVGASPYVPLNATQMRKAVSDWSLPGFPTCQKIFTLVGRCFSGELTPDQTIQEIGKITGDTKGKAKKAS